MKSNKDKDLREKIEQLEKLIDEVKKQNEEEKKKLRLTVNRPARPKIVKIDLALEYSTDPIINLIVGFLVNFILVFSIIQGFGLAEAENNYIFLVISSAFTLYETVLKRYLFQRHQTLVIYSSGIIFFLANLLFFYAMDLVVFIKNFTFTEYYYPIIFVFVFQVIRVIFKNLYVAVVARISVKATDKK